MTPRRQQRTASKNVDESPSNETEKRHPSRRSSDSASGEDKGANGLEYYDPTSGKETTNPMKKTTHSIACQQAQGDSQSRWRDQSRWITNSKERSTKRDGLGDEPSVLPPSSWGRLVSSMESVAPAPPPRLQPVSRPVSRPGAFCVAPTLPASGRDTNNSENESNNDDTSTMSSSLYVIPRASLVRPDGTTDDDTITALANRPVPVTHEPELVHASPLDMTILQRLSSPSTGSRLPPPVLPPQEERYDGDLVENAGSSSRRYKRKNGIAIDQTKPKDKASSYVIVNKRWLWLLAIVVCLVVSAVTGGVVYYVVNNGSKTSTGSKKGGNSSNNGNNNNNNNNRKPDKNNSKDDDDRSSNSDGLERFLRG